MKYNRRRLFLLGRDLNIYGLLKERSSSFDRKVGGTCFGNRTGEAVDDNVHSDDVLFEVHILSVDGQFFAISGAGYVIYFEGERSDNQDGIVDGERGGVFLLVEGERYRARREFGVNDFEEVFAIHEDFDVAVVFTRGVYVVGDTVVGCVVVIFAVIAAGNECEGHGHEHEQINQVLFHNIFF